jgi:hypothetical protein
MNGVKHWDGGRGPSNLLNLVVEDLHDLVG